MLLITATDCCHTMAQQIQSQTIRLHLSAGTTGIGLTAGSTLPINNTSSKLPRLSQVNKYAFLEKNLQDHHQYCWKFRVTLTFRDSDGAALPTVMASDTTGV